MVSEPLESSEGLAMADEGLNEAEASILKTSFDQFALGQEEIRKSMNEVKVMLLQLLKAKISTPLWIAELSDMADEVRDRTILVKINSQVHPINDLVIYHVFSEIGTVEDVRYLPTESGFHSRVRFRIKQSSDWAFHYYNGRRLHQGCCELEIHRANDVINWNLQRIAYLEAACVGVDAPAITKDDCLLAAKPKNDKVLKYIEESTEIDIKDEHIDTKKPSDFVACKVLDEMSDGHECKLFDEMSKSDKVLSHTEESFKVEKLLSIEIDEHKDEVPPVSSEREQDDLKAVEMADSVDEDTSKGHVRVLCFDPGGGASLLVGGSLILEDVARDRRYCDKELVEMPNLLGNCLSSIGMNQLELPTSIEQGEAIVPYGYLLMSTLSCKLMPIVDDVLNQEDDPDEFELLDGNQEDDPDEVELLDGLAVKNGVVTVLVDNILMQHSVFIGKIKQEKISFEANLTFLFDKMHLQSVEGYLENLMFECYNSRILIFDPGGQLLSHELVVSWFLVDMDKTYLRAHVVFDGNTASIINLQLLLGHYFGVAGRAVGFRSHVLQSLESISLFRESKASLMELDKHIWKALAESETGYEFSYLGVDFHGARRLIFDPGGESFTFVYSKRLHGLFSQPRFIEYKLYSLFIGFYPPGSLLCESRKQVPGGLMNIHHEIMWLGAEVDTTRYGLNGKIGEDILLERAKILLQTFAMMNQMMQTFVKSLENQRAHIHNDNYEENQGFTFESVDQSTFDNFEAQIPKDEQVGDMRSLNVDAKLLFVAADEVFHLPRMIFVFDPGTKTQSLLIVLTVQHSSHQSWWRVTRLLILIFEDKDLFKQGGMIQE